jgi:hypothetical protein
MDKDSVILKYEQENASDIDKELQDLSKSNDGQAKELAELQEKLCKLNGNKEKPVISPTPKIRLRAATQTIKCESSYEELYAVAAESLAQRGLSADELDFNGLVTCEELDVITRELNRPLPREETWRKSDFIATFIAGFVGCAADIILSGRNNKYTGQNSKFSQKLNELHEKTFKHKSGAPIDYQGTGFGGGHHRELSKGHDLARFVEGIKMFKEGKFEGIVFENGVKKTIVMTANQFGTAYGQLSTIEAIIGYASHMFADLFSTYSLPFPGYSFLRESNARELRILAADMYKNGFNLKNVMTQSLSAIIIEVIVRLFYSIQAVKDYADKVELTEDYSNLDAIKEFINPSHKEKLNEMLLVAHSIVMAENTGKIIFKCLVVKDLKAASEINIAEIIAVVNYGIKFVNAAAARDNTYAKLIYHADEINAQWEEIGSTIGADEVTVIADTQPLLIGA